MTKFLAPIWVFSRSESVQSHFQNDGQSPVLLNRAGMWSLVLLVVSIVFLLIFRSTDQIDLFVSELFFAEADCVTLVEGARCGKFPTRYHPDWQFAREIGHNLPPILMAATSLHLSWLLMFKANKTLHQLYPPLIALMSGLAGPLLAVNIILKEFWGRPRPSQTSFFDGENPYVPPGDISSYCESNCSFVSGEAAAAFWMLALMFYFKGRARIWFVVAILPVASFIAMLRVAFGRHYISDVVMAALLMMLIIVLSVWISQTLRGRNWIERLRQFSNKNAFNREKPKNS